METSESQSVELGELAAALAKAQGQIRNAVTDSENPHFRSKYADLASVWDACRGALSANGLAVMQRVSTSAEGVVITTQLLHSSGQWVKDSATFPVAQRTPQGIGSAITYGRRYALSALVGVAQGEDDDGNADSAPPSQERRASRQVAAKVARVAEPKPAPVPMESRETDAAHLRARRSKIWKRAESAGATEASFKTWASQCLGVAKPSQEITAEDCAKLEAELERGFNLIAEPPSDEEPIVLPMVRMRALMGEFKLSDTVFWMKAADVCGKSGGWTHPDVEKMHAALLKGAK